MSALDYGVLRLSDAVLSRAINGAVPVFFQGEQIGEKRYYNERLGMFVLRYRGPMRYGRWLDRREFSGHPRAGALALAEAKRNVRADAELGADAVGDRVELRLEELAQQRLREGLPKERGEGEDERDVASC